MRRRTHARRLVLEVLYQVDLLGPDVVEDSLNSPAGLEPEPAAAGRDLDAQNFARELVRGVIEHVEDIDNRIRAVAENWDLTRMATVDRNILRLGTYELVYRDDIPPKVSINEAVELAKCYSTAESGTFVNGILDRIKSQLEPGDESSQQQGGEQMEMEDE